MNRKLIVLAGVVGLVLVGFGDPAIKDGSLVGWWRFDGASEAARKVDSSGCGGILTAFASNVSTQEGGGLTGGCLDIQTAGNTATVTLGSEVSIAASAVVGFGTDAVVEGDRVQATLSVEAARTGRRQDLHHGAEGRRGGSDRAQHPGQDRRRRVS